MLWTDCQIYHLQLSKIIKNNWFKSHSMKFTIVILFDFCTCVVILQRTSLAVICYSDNRLRKSIFIVNRLAVKSVLVCYGLLNCVYVGFSMYFVKIKIQRFDQCSRLYVWINKYTYIYRISEDEEIFIYFLLQNIMQTPIRNFSYI